jgi:hypothetical protein
LLPSKTDRNLALPPLSPSTTFYLNPLKCLRATLGLSPPPRRSNNSWNRTTTCATSGSETRRKPGSLASAEHLAQEHLRRSGVWRRGQRWRRRPTTTTTTKSAPPNTVTPNCLQRQ